MGGYWRHIAVYVCCGLIGNFAFHYQPFLGAALPDILLCLKFWLCIGVGQYAFKKLDIKKNANSILAHVKFITWAYLILTIVDNVRPIFRSSIRYGFRSTQLYYSHPTVFVACCVLLMTILLLLKDYISRRVFIRYSAILSVLAASTLRSKAFGCVLIYWMIYYFVFIRHKKITVKTILMFAPLVVIIGWEQIEFYFLSSIQQGSARYQLLMKAFFIGRDHFPIGAGFGTYASYYSAIHYSPLYRKYGISLIQGLMQGDAAFVSDSFWPMILGETGWIGLIAYILAIYVLFIKNQKNRFDRPTYYSGGIFILGYLLVESTAASAFVHPLSIPMAMILGMILDIGTGRNKTIRGD